MHRKRLSLAIAWSLLGLSLALGWLLSAWPHSSKALAPSSALATGTWTVCPAGPPGCDFAALQDAIDAATPGDTIKVAAGTYTQLNTRGGMTQTVYLSKTVTLRGGYTAPVFAEPPDPAARPAVLDAGGQGRVVSIVGSVQPTLEGFHLRGGTADRGGGVYLDGSDATLRTNTITGNSAEWGGGVWLGDSRATLDENTVADNSALYGGGLVLWSSDATLTGNRIASNVGSAGGGVFLSGSEAVLEANTIRSNTAGYGGGLVLTESDARLVNNIVADNQATDDSSALYIQGSAPRLLHTTLARNQGGDGTGVTVSSGSPVFTNTILVSHTVGIYLMSGSSATLEGTLWGSGAWANGSDWAGSGTILIGTANRWEEPGFAGANVGDFHIRFGSAAMDAGVDAGIAVDIDGEPRPAFNSTDIGADEYYEAPIASLVATNDSPTVLGHSTALTATVSAGSHISYTWALGDGTAGSGPVITHTYPDIGVYVAVVTARNRVSLVTASTTVHITEAPALRVYLPLVLKAHPLPPTATPTPTATHTPTPTDTPTPTPTATSGPPPELPPLVILDLSGVQRDWNWLRDTFGNVNIYRAGAGTAYRVCVLKAIEGPATLVVKVTDDGQPLEGLTVIRYWPGAPYLLPDLVGWFDRGVYGQTNANGEIGFGMGTGDYYQPPGGGASAIWVHGLPSDLVTGLGMLWGTNHIHLDTEFCRWP